jgi:methyl-accepting chemotaxis protein
VAYIAEMTTLQGAKMQVINLSIKQKMAGLIVFLLGVAVVVTVLMVVTFIKINSSMDKMDKIDQIQHAAFRGNVAMLKARQYEAEFFTRKDDKWIARVEKSVEEVYAALDQIEKLTADKKIKEHSDRARGMGKQYVAQFKELVKTAKGSNFDPGATKDGIEDLRDVLNDFEPQMDTYIPKLAGDQYKKAAKELDTTILTAKYTMLSVLIGSAVAQVAILLIIVLPLLRSISGMTERLRDIATGEGDLTKRIEVVGADEIAETAKWFNTFVGRLAEVIGRVANDARKVSGAAEKVQLNSRELLVSTQDISRQAESVAVAAEQMSATAYEIANSCNRSAESAAQADNATQTGSKVIQETIEGMNRIADKVKEAANSVEELGSKSNQIGSIVRTIEDIADQTNMLALNAAIEAARAGEQGRGFAVVADEVRALSERTTKATKEIGDMIKMVQKETQSAVKAIEYGVSEVENGSSEAARSGEALGLITSEMQNVTSQMGQIATAAGEQSNTTNTISHSIRSITDVAQQSTLKAGDSAESAEELTRVAEELQELMAKFKV